MNETPPKHSASSQWLIRCVILCCLCLTAGAQTNGVSLLLTWTDTNSPRPDAYMALFSTNPAATLDKWQKIGSTAGTNNGLATSPLTPQYGGIGIVPSNLWTDPNAWATNPPQISNIVTTPPPAGAVQNLNAKRQ